MISIRFNVWVSTTFIISAMGSALGLALSLTLDLALGLVFRAEFSTENVNCFE